MKMKDALELIKDIQKVETGYMISFEKKEGGMLVSDHFPDKHAGEELIETEYSAWELAKDFAEVSKDKYINIYVVNSSFEPILTYGRRTFNKY